VKKEYEEKAKKDEEAKRE
jgi:hypothetical protein